MNLLKPLALQQMKLIYRTSNSILNSWIINRPPPKLRKKQVHIPESKVTHMKIQRAPFKFQSKLPPKHNNFKEPKIKSSRNYAKIIYIQDRSINLYWNIKDNSRIGYSSLNTKRWRKKKLTQYQLHLLQTHPSIGYDPRFNWDN